MTTANYKSIASKLKFEGRAFIGGKLVDAIDGGKFESINPDDINVSPIKINKRLIIENEIGKNKTFFENTPW